MFEFIRDWSRVKKCKAELLEALRQTPVGGGITVSDLKNPIISRSIIELLKEHPNDIEMVDNSMTVTLFRKVTMHASLSQNTYDHFRESHAILTADGAVKLGLEVALPNRKWRDGVPDDVNGTGGPNVEEEEKLIISQEEHRMWEAKNRGQ